MKIFTNFDTNLDIKTFNKAINEFWNNNVLLVKRHPLFLIKAFIFWLIILLLFTAWLYLNYFLYKNSLDFFFIFSFFHVIWILIWLVILFHNIIRHLFTYKEFIYNNKDIKYIELKKFDLFLISTFILFTYYVIILILDIYFLDRNNLVNNYYFIFFIQFVINIISLYFIIKIIYRFIDFEMDFFIITHSNIESFDQEWLFKRNTVTINTSYIRSITVKKKWLINSIFNIWSLIVLSEWDNDHNWEIKFNYIHRLGTLKSSIYRLIHNKSVNYSIKKKKKIKYKNIYKINK